MLKFKKIIPQGRLSCSSCRQSWKEFILHAAAVKIQTFWNAGCWLRLATDFLLAFLFLFILQTTCSNSVRVRSELFVPMMILALIQIMIILVIVWVNVLSVQTSWTNNSIPDRISAVGRSHPGAYGGQLLLTLRKHVFFFLTFCNPIYLQPTPEVTFIRP